MPTNWPVPLLPERTLALIGAGLQEKTRGDTSRLRSKNRVFLFDVTKLGLVTVTP